MNVRDAFYQTVHSVPGGCEALAPRMGMSAAILRNKANVNSLTNKPTLEDADRVIGLTGDMRLLHALAANHGHVCIRLDAEAVASEQAVIELGMLVWAGSGDVGAEVSRTLADGRVDRHEVERVRSAIYRTNQAMQQLAARLDEMAGPTHRKAVE